MKVLEQPKARAELQDAAIWYDSKNAGLGAQFLDAVEQTVEPILEWPMAAPLVHGMSFELPGQIRSIKVNLFPYRILYAASKTRVIILAYAHQRKHPHYWHARTTN